MEKDVVQVESVELLHKCELASQAKLFPEQCSRDISALLVVNSTTNMAAYGCSSAAYLSSLEPKTSYLIGKECMEEGVGGGVKKSQDSRGESLESRIRNPINFRSNHNTARVGEEEEAIEVLCVDQSQYRISTSIEVLSEEEEEQRQFSILLFETLPSEYGAAPECNDGENGRSRENLPTNGIVHFTVTTYKKTAGVLWITVLGIYSPAGAEDSGPDPQGGKIAWEKFACYTGTITICEGPGAAPLGIEPSSSCREASGLATTPPRHPKCLINEESDAGPWLNRRDDVNKAVKTRNVQGVEDCKYRMMVAWVRETATALGIRISMEQRLNARVAGEGEGNPREKPSDQRLRPARFPLAKMGIEPDSPRWKASSLTTTPTRPHKATGYAATRIKCAIDSTLRALNWRAFDGNWPSRAVYMAFNHYEVGNVNSGQSCVQYNQRVYGVNKKTHSPFPICRLPLTARQSQLSLQSRRNHLAWTAEEWRCIGYSDESSVYLDTDDNRTGMLIILRNRTVSAGSNYSPHLSRFLCLCCVAASDAVMNARNEGLGSFKVAPAAANTVALRRSLLAGTVLRGHQFLRDRQSSDFTKITRTSHARTHACMRASAGSNHVYTRNCDFLLYAAASRRMQRCKGRHASKMYARAAVRRRKQLPIPDGEMCNTRAPSADRSSEPMRVIEVSMELRRNDGAGVTGDPREDPPTNGIVGHDSHLRKSGDPTGD
ncbi:hypothetical protein PR048_028911 [Dryococelus australis]|uniref:Uncharacterized protein n=1 Tax=Dryococelus australis TaxID=614101 RepID=A0ABQ9GBW5_9NEOP|nr:hypothetical protein PR048_028911 [Dryococelus australis]